MSEVKVNKISPRTNCGTVQLGDSGDTITIPAGATITNNGTQTGFGRTGTVNWNTTKITADPANAVSGTGYFADTTGGAFNVTLPTSPSAGDIVAVADYANTFDTNNLTIVRNGSNIEGDAENFVCNQEGVSITFVYVDATKGWITVNAGNSSQAFVSNYVSATGGTITTDGDFKVHSFTSPGTFTVLTEGTAAGSNSVNYLVVGGGGSGAGSSLGGGGAGGFRMASCFSICAVAYPITVGAGGAVSPGQNQGSNSIFSSITSAGGGAGGNSPPSQSPDLSKGGSGGAIGRDAFLAGRTSANNGNSPPVSPPQGNPGGVYAYSSPGTDQGSAGGGGAAGTGANGSPGNNGGAGGAGSPAAPVFGSAPKPFYIANGPANGASACGQFAGGGGGGAYPSGGRVGGSGGVGGGGNGGGGSTSTAVNNGTANTGGGGGGNHGPPCGSSGGSGIVLIRYKFQN